MQNGCLTAMFICDFGFAYCQPRYTTAQLCAVLWAAYNTADTAYSLPVPYQWKLYLCTLR